MENGVFKKDYKETFKNGDVYEGAWNHGKVKGKGKTEQVKGIMTYADGSKYEGEWLKGKKNG